MTVCINELPRNQITDYTNTVCFQVDPNYQLNWWVLVMWKRCIQFLRFRLFLSSERISLVLRVGNHLTILKHSVPPKKYKLFFYIGVNTLSRATQQAVGFAFAFYSLARPVSGACCLYGSILSQGGVVSSWCVWLLFCIQFKPWIFAAFKQQPKVDYVFPSKTANFSLFERIRDKR